MILDVVSSLWTLHKRADDDYIDRLHYFMTSNLLIALAVLVSFKQFGGKPIECMTPKMYPGSWEEYAENFCWAQDNYFLPFDTAVVPTDEEIRYERKISYYQWVPFFLLFEALCFRIPSIIWKYLAGHSGIQIHDLVKLANDEANIKVETRKENLKSLTIHLQNALRFHRRLFKKRITPHQYLRPLNLPYSAFFVTFMYIFVKVLYLVNALLQLVLMNEFLLTKEYTMYGFDALHDILSGHSWEKSGVFPRVTMCDFYVRMMGSNVQMYSVQCVLVINIFNEKIFVFLWFWFMLLSALTLCSILYWIILMFVPPFARWFISRHLELSELPFDPQGSRKDVERFVAGYLKKDGIFILRMITMHAGIIFGTDLTLSLWRAFYGLEEDIKRQQSHATLTPSPTKETPTDKNKFSFLRLRPIKFRGESDKTNSKDLMEVLIPEGAGSRSVMVPRHSVAAGIKKQLDGLLGPPAGQDDIDAKKNLEKSYSNDGTMRTADVSPSAPPDDSDTPPKTPTPDASATKSLQV